MDDIEKDARFAKINDPKYGTGSFICMPVRVGDRVIGVINLAKKEDASTSPPTPRPFSPTDLQFLTALLTYIGYAVDNARLLHEAQQSATQLQNVVDDLRATQAQLVRGETLSAIGKLASGMAHHLNNLFAVILGRLETLQSKVPDPEARRYLEIVQRAAQDGAEVVRRVQRFSRVQPVSRTMPVDLNQLAQEVLDLTRPRWHNEALLRQIRIDTALDLGSIQPVAGELAPLREVLMNLVLNAIDAMPDGGRLGVKTWADEQGVHCDVSDSGAGMSDEVRQRALDPFFTTKGPKSTGLGLSVTYGIIQRHNGKLEIDSAPGKRDHGAHHAAPRPARLRPRRDPQRRRRRLRPSCACCSWTTSPRCARRSPTCSAARVTRPFRPRAGRKRWRGSKRGSLSTSCSPTSACRG